MSETGENDNGRGLSVHLDAHSRQWFIFKTVSPPEADRRSYWLLVGDQGGYPTEEAAVNAMGLIGR